MFRFCLLFAKVAFLEKLDTILRQITAHFKAKKVYFNWIVCAILRLKMSADNFPLGVKGKDRVALIKSLIVGRGAWRAHAIEDLKDFDESRSKM